METGNSNKITHYHRNKLLNAEFLIWKNSVLLSSLLCLLLHGLRSQIIGVQWLFRLWLCGLGPALTSSTCITASAIGLEVLSSRRLAEYLAHGKHSTALVAFVATMIFCPLPPTIFWKTCKHPRVRCKAAAGKGLLPFGGHRDGCGGTDVCWLGCDLAFHDSIQFSKTRPPSPWFI